MALPHDLRDMELRSYVEVPVAARGQPDNPTAQRVVLSDASGAPFDSGDGSLSVEQGPAAAIQSPWWFGFVDPTTRVWAQVSPGIRDPQRGALVTNQEGLKATYTGIVNNITPGTTATDFVTLAGSPVKTLHITRVEVVGVATALAQASLLLVLRSTPDTGGTTSAVTAITSHDAQNPTSQAVLTAYTTTPTSGAFVGTIRQTTYQLVSTTAVAGSAPFVLVWDFGLRNEQCPVLRGASNLLCFGQGGNAVATGTSYIIAITWTEE